MQELVAPPRQGRIYALERRAGLADCAPSGRMRLDALARWLQDVALADVEDAGLAEKAVWVVRKTRIRVARFPRFGEARGVATFCSGIGSMWAERRTTVVAAGTVAGNGGPVEPDVEAVSLWVHLDPQERRPSRLTDEELRVYGATGSDRLVRARLHHPPPPPTAERSPWTFRRAECDVADHVNNAAYWAPLEEELLAGPEPDRLDVEMEFRTGAQPGEKALLVAGSRRWIAAGDGEVHASLLIAELSAAGERRRV